MATIEMPCPLCHGSGVGIPLGLFCNECGAQVAEMRVKFDINQETKIAHHYHSEIPVVSSVYPCGHSRGATSASVPCICNGAGFFRVSSDKHNRFTARPITHNIDHS